MAQDRIVEALAALSHDLPVRILIGTVCEQVAELSAILALAAFKDLPPELLTRLRALEKELREISQLCQSPPEKADPKETKIQAMPLF